MLPFGALAVGVGLLFVVVCGLGVRERAPRDDGARRSQRVTTETDPNGAVPDNMVLIDASGISEPDPYTLADAADHAADGLTLLGPPEFPEFPRLFNATEAIRLGVIGPDGLAASR